MNRVRQRIAAIHGTLKEADWNTVSGPMKSLASRQNTVNKYLSDLGHTYHATIPLDDIFKKLRENGFEPVQEDDTPWSGILLGRDSRMNVKLIVANATVNRFLTLSWHKMEVSGKFEITAYVS